MFAYNSRGDPPICHKLACLCLEIFCKGQNSGSALGSNPGEDVFCNSETKDDRRTDKSFGEGITGTKTTKLNNVLGSNPGEDIFCTLEVNGVEQHRYDQYFIGKAIVGTNATTPRKVSWVRVLVKILFLYNGN
jgi:hypothetical protein